MSDIIYRTPGAWGSGQGSNLNAAQVDMNFWLLYSAIVALQDHALTTENQIDYFAVSGSNLYVHMANHEVFGPYPLPTAQWNFTGPWVANSLYNTLDVFSEDGALYVCINGPFTSADSFNSGANNGHGENYYSLLLAQPPDELPDDGTTGQRLVKTSDSPYAVEWVSDTRILALFVPGSPEPSALLLQFVSVDPALLFPAGLSGSAATCGTEPTTEQQYTIYKNGTYIGEVTFSPSPSISFTFDAAVTFDPGDVFQFYAPAHPDLHMTNISFSFVGLLS